MSKAKRYVVVPGQGDLCPRCHRPTQIREHAEITKKHRAQPFYYSRWFYCRNSACRTSLIMPARYQVFPNAPERERLAAIVEQLTPRG